MKQMEINDILNEIRERFASILPVWPKLTASVQEKIVHSGMHPALYDLNQEEVATSEGVPSGLDSDDMSSSYGRLKADCLTVWEAGGIVVAIESGVIPWQKPGTDNGESETKVSYASIRSLLRNLRFGTLFSESGTGAPELTLRGRGLGQAFVFARTQKVAGNGNISSSAGNVYFQKLNRDYVPFSESRVSQGFASFSGDQYQGLYFSIYDHPVWDRTDGSDPYLFKKDPEVGLHPITHKGEALRGRSFWVSDIDSKRVVILNESDPDFSEMAFSEIGGEAGRPCSRDTLVTITAGKEDTIGKKIYSNDDDLHRYSYRLTPTGEVKRGALLATELRDGNCSDQLVQAAGRYYPLNSYTANGSVGEPIVRGGDGRGTVFSSLLVIRNAQGQWNILDPELGHRLPSGYKYVGEGTNNIELAQSCVMDLAANDFAMFNPKFARAAATDPFGEAPSPALSDFDGPSCLEDWPREKWVELLTAAIGRNAYLQVSNLPEGISICEEHRRLYPSAHEEGCHTCVANNPNRVSGWNRGHAPMVLGVVGQDHLIGFEIEKQTIRKASREGDFVGDYPLVACYETDSSCGLEAKTHVYVLEDGDHRDRFYKDVKASIPVTNSPIDDSCGGHINLSGPAFESKSNLQPYAGLLYSMFKTRLNLRYCNIDPFLIGARNAERGDGETKYCVVRMHRGRCELRFPSAVKNSGQMLRRYDMCLALRDAILGSWSWDTWCDVMRRIFVGNGVYTRQKWDEIEENGEKFSDMIRWQSKAGLPEKLQEFIRA